MADTRSPDSVAQLGDDMVDVAEKLGAGLVRVSTAVVTLPFRILPPKERDEAVGATRDLFSAVGVLHLSVARAAISGLGAATRELSKVVDETTSASNRVVTHVPIETK